MIKWERANGTYQLQMCTSVSGMVNGGLKQVVY